MRAIRVAAREAAERTGIPAADLTMRFGMHWGSTLYVGRLMTSGRAEVTALGDEEPPSATEKARRDAPAIAVCEL